MGKLAIWAQLEAKPGKEKELEEFLKSAQRFNFCQDGVFLTEVSDQPVP